MAKYYSIIVVLSFTFVCCKTGGSGIFAKKSPHQQYGDKLAGAGLKETALGRAWFEAADRSLTNPLGITIPYKETGYFSAEQPRAAGFGFQAKRGQKLTIALSKKPTSGFTVYLELWKAAEAAGQQPKLVTALDSATFELSHEVDDEGVYVLRLQPELLKGGEYTITISIGPSLAYPIAAKGRNHIQSVWGDARDAGARKHEGIDMFAPKLTPVVAAADGRVTRVNENNLGGKVVWMRPFEKNYALYYAHLDQQLVRDGQSVKVGDTLGLIGNTGNARNTAPHLHFGIYGFNGAIDPLPFVDPAVKAPPAITAPVARIGELVRVSSKKASLLAGMNEPAVSLDQYTLLKVEAATGQMYKVSLPGGVGGLIKSNETDVISSLRKLTLKDERAVYDLPDTAAARKQILKAGDAVSILAAFNNYYYIRTNADVAGWILK